MLEEEIYGKRDSNFSLGKKGADGGSEAIRDLSCWLARELWTIRAGRGLKEKFYYGLSFIC